MRIVLQHMRIPLLIIALLLAPTSERLRAWEATCGLEPGPLRPGVTTVPGEVMELQQRLAVLGFYHGPIDGRFGPELESVVRQFQKQRGLVADGVVGEATWQALAEGSDVLVSTASRPKPEGNMHIVVNIDSLSLVLYVDGKPYKRYPVAVGRPTNATWSPVGEWKIVNKGKWGGGFGTRWMGLNVPWGIYGIHGTNKPYSIGTRASHGCIRMFNHHVEELYAWVPIGTRVIIEGHQPPIKFNRTIKLGSSGKDVVQVQKRLAELGFGAGGADGRYGPASEQATRALQRLYGLPEDGQVYDDVYHILGFR